MQPNLHNYFINISKYFPLKIHSDRLQTDNKHTSAAKALNTTNKKECKKLNVVACMYINNIYSTTKNDYQRKFSSHTSTASHSINVHCASYLQYENDAVLNSQPIFKNFSLSDDSPVNLQ